MNKFIRLTAILLACITLFACKDDSTSPEHKHFEAVGMVITNSGNEIVRNENGKVTGKISVKEGEETALLSVKFIDEHNGNLTVPKEDHYTLGYKIADETFAEFEQHADDGKWKFHIHGKKAGSTTIEIKILHNDHSDFVSLPVTIEITK